MALSLFTSGFLPLSLVGRFSVKQLSGLEKSQGKCLSSPRRFGNERKLGVWARRSSPSHLIRTGRPLGGTEPSKSRAGQQLVLGWSRKDKGKSDRGEKVKTCPEEENLPRLQALSYVSQTCWLKATRLHSGCPRFCFPLIFEHFRLNKLTFIPCAGVFSHRRDSHVSMNFCRCRCVSISIRISISGSF